MVNSHFIRRSTLVILSITAFLFLFVSCSSNNIGKLTNKFLGEFKSKNFESSYTYLFDDDMKEKFSSYIALFGESQDENLNESVNKLNDVILNKLVNITYEVNDEVRDLDDSSKELTVNIGYYNIGDAYESALEEFLSRSLDFDNLDNLYNTETIVNILTTHIDKLKREEASVNVMLTKDLGSWKIKMNEEFLDILVGNSATILENFKSMIISE